MTSFKDFLRRYNNKDVVPTLEAMQKRLLITTIKIHTKRLHKFTDVKFSSSTEADKDTLEKNREDVVGGPSIVFARKAVVDETFVRKSTNICKSIVGIDARQLNPYSMCQPMPTGLYTRWELDSEMSRLTPRQNKTRTFEHMVISYFQRTRPEC